MINIRMVTVVSNLTGYVQNLVKNEFMANDDG